MAPLRQPFRASQAQQTQFSGVDSQLTTDSPPRSTRGSEPKVQLCDKCDAHEGGEDTFRNLGALTLPIPLRVAKVLLADFRSVHGQLWS